MPRSYTWLDQKYVILPNVVGMNIENAQKELKGFRIEYTGNGDEVIYQSPEANRYVKENSTVVLMLN